MDLDSFRLFYLHLTSLPTLLAISRMWIQRVLLGLLQLFLVAKCTPPGFPSSGNGLWYKEPGMIWSRDWLPVGNGYLAGVYYILYFSSICWSRVFSHDTWRYELRGHSAQHRIFVVRWTIALVCIFCWYPRGTCEGLPGQIAARKCSWILQRMSWWRDTK